MTETIQNDNGGDVKQGVSQHAGLIGGLLIISGAGVSLFMAFKKVTKTLLWLVPVALYGFGIALAIEATKERRTRIKETQDEIVSLLDQLDPVAKAQVATHVAKEEFGKSQPTGALLRKL